MLKKNKWQSIFLQIEHTEKNHHIYVIHILFKYKSQTYIPIKKLPIVFLHNFDKIIHTHN